MPLPPINSKQMLGLSLAAGAGIGATMGLGQASKAIKNGGKPDYMPAEVMGGLGVVASGAGLLMRKPEVLVGGIAAMGAGIGVAGSNLYCVWDAKDGEMGNSPI